MKNYAFLIFAAFTLIGCPGTGTNRPDPLTPEPTPTPYTNDYFGDMCARLRDLRCEEGNDVYNDNMPGPVDEANQSCESFYEETEDLGIKVNPKCVRLVSECSQIEAAREKDPETCN